ncbi:MAG TPA: aldo/keto reductase [Flavitalea sp.]|nr:aldo/keto reductase [Flavitalea sp.]
MTNSLSKLIAGTMKWGQWGARFSTEQYLTMIKRCLDLGVSTFDHADIYGHYTTEEEFGVALKQEPSLRHKMQLISKCGIRMVTPNRPAHKIKSYDTSRKHIIESAHRSLENLHTDFLDILLIHRPDPLMDPDEIAEAFTQLQTQGKVKAFGISNFNAQQSALIESRFPVGYNQLEISIVEVEPFLDGTLHHCMLSKIVPMAWSPLGGGNIFIDQEEERNKRIVAVASILAEKYNAMPDQVLLSWLLCHPAGIVPVLGTSKAERIDVAMKATSIKLEREEWFLLWRASTGTEVA